MSQLLDQLNHEIDLLSGSGATNLAGLLDESDAVLRDLRALEAELQLEVSGQGTATDVLAIVDKDAKKWYDRSIASLKSYNGQITKFLKNIVLSSRYNVPLDEAYSFPLMLNAYPSKETAVKTGSEEDAVNAAKLRNRQQLMKSIVLHLVKIGHGSAVVEMLDEFEVGEQLDSQILDGFRQLNEIVDDVKVKHDLTRVFAWLDSRDPSASTRYQHLLFKLHMLKFALLLAGSVLDAAGVNHDSIVAAYTYAKTHFYKFSKEYLNEISPVMTLLVYKFTDGSDSTLIQESFKRAMVETFSQDSESSKVHAEERQFIAKVLGSVDTLHANHAIFHNLANEFVAEYCADMSLSNDSLLFQSILAGFVNLPNFYKYNNLQRRLSRTSREDPKKQDDLPFQLPDKNHFLFNFHPIFICPVSKEQLVPLSTTAKITDEDFRDKRKKYIYVSPSERLAAMNNPVVVFDHCRHLALKDSVRHLTKGGSEVFKCHYCYKKHKLQDVSDAYFIDL